VGRDIKSLGPQGANVRQPRSEEFVLTMAKKPEPATLGPLEAEIMRIVWADGELTVRDVHEKLRGRGAQLAYTTVMTVMARLADKGILSRKRVGRSFLYTVRVDEEAFRRRTARMLAQRLVSGFDSLGIASFVEEVAKVGPERLRELQESVRRATRKT
jgi:predicted transcriptional regulator